jgi:hypothetical protein
VPRYTSRLECYPVHLVLCPLITSRKVAGSNPDALNSLSIYLILPAALDPGVYSASNRN